MSHSITPSPRTGKIAGLGLALLLAVAISAESAAAPPVSPQDSVRGFYDHDERWSNARAKRTLCEAGAHHWQAIRCSVNGSARRRPALGNPLSDPAAAGDGGFRTLHFGDICRSIR